MREAHVALLIDDKTNSLINNTSRRNVLRLVDEVVSVKFDDKFNNMERSRLLKTGMRNYISGDFLFIDSDTIITETLDSVDDFTFDIGAVRELHRGPVDTQTNFLRIKKFTHLIGGEIDPNSIYFNSGVLYVKDNEMAREFFSTWSELWMKGYEQGVKLDQPSLALVNQKYNYLIKELDGVWNCQIYWGLEFLFRSKIIHYFYSNDSFKNTSLMYINNTFFRKIKSNDYELSKTDRDIILNPYQYFKGSISIIYGTDTDIWDSYLVRLVRFLFAKRVRIFSLLNRLAEIVFRNHIT